jgi:hypothetical protein
MESAFLEIAKQVPAVLALIYLVVIFIRSLDKRDDRLASMQKTWTETIEKSAKLGTDAIERNVIALTSTASSMERNTAALIKFTDYFEQFKRYHDQNHEKNFVKKEVT